MTISKFRLQIFADHFAAAAESMPTVVTANTNATTIMIGEKASDLIRGRRLQPIEIDMTAIA